MALVDSDDRCSFYTTRQRGELRVTHRFGGDTVLLECDDRCFLYSAACGELRMTYRFSGFTRISPCSAAGNNLWDWLKVLGSRF